MWVSHLEGEVWTEINVHVCYEIQAVIQADLAEVFKQSLYAEKNDF